MALFESYERREKQILAKLAEYGINSIEEAAEVTKAAGLDVYKMVEGIQPICFENAKWAYTVGAAIAIKRDVQRQLMQQQQSEKDFSLSVFRDLLQIREKLVLDMVILEKCFLKKTQNVLLS